MTHPKTDYLIDSLIPVKPEAPAMKLISVPRGMQLIVSIDGSTDRLEIVNPSDGRQAFFRLHEAHRSSEAIHLKRESEANYGDLS